MLNELAQRGSGLEDWINIIIVLLLVGGSVFGAVAKKLISAFTPKESGDAVKPPPAPVARPVPRPPVARKAPRAERPAESKREMPPVLAEIIEQVSGRPVEHAPRRHRTKTMSRKSTRRPAQQRAPAPPIRPESQLRVDEPLPGERLAHLHWALENEERQFGGGVENRLEHLQSSFDDELRIAEPAEAIRVKPSIGAAWPAHFTPKGLRRAVILSEIISPPVALRTPVDRF